jgi:hypothetical protein
VVDQHPDAGVLQQRRQLHQLVPLYLHVREHVEAREGRQQWSAVSEVRDAQQGCLHGRAHDAEVTQPLQLRPVHVVVDHSNALEATRSVSEKVEKATIVGVVAGVGADHQRMPHAVGVEQTRHLACRSLLALDRVVPRFRRVGKGHRIEQVVVTVDLGLVEDGHSGQYLARGCRGIRRAGAFPARGTSSVPPDRPYARPPCECVERQGGRRHR